MGMMLVVVIDRTGEHLQNGCGIGSGSDFGVVALEDFDEGLADAIALGASHRCLLAQPIHRIDTGIAI